MRVDTQWFNDMISRTAYGSQRRIARKIRGRHGRPLDPAALSLMLRGKRAMQISEARQFADILNVPLIEVLRRAGISVPDEQTKHVPVAGHIDKNGTLVMHSPDESELVPAPSDVPADSVVIRCQTARSDYALIDGWQFFVEKPGPAKPDHIGRFCVVSAKGHDPGVAFVARGYKAGTYNLTAGIYFGHAHLIENATIDWASAVIWIRP